MVASRLQKMFVFVLGISFALASTSVRGFSQGGSQGSIVVTVDDSTQAVIPGATLTLVSLRTNDTRTAVAGPKGNYTFVNLPIGEYRLTIAKAGYKTTVYDSILVVSSQATDIGAKLPVGAASETVDVGAGKTPLIEGSSNAIGTIIDLKQIEDLPLSGRNLSTLASLVPGFAGNPGSTTGSFNGQGLTSQGSNIDGVSGSPARGKYNGNIAPAVSPRIEDIEQMSIVTDQLDLNSGFGQATSQLNFVSRSGSNQFHGRAYNNFRNSALFANSWTNDVTNTPKPKSKYNDFGVSVGGPVLRDKLFFFGTFASLRQPGSAQTSDVFIGTAAQTGNFTYSGGTVNILTLANQQNPALSASVNSVIAQQLSVINSSVQGSSISATSDPNLSRVSWNALKPTTNYYPAARLDYTLSSKARMNLAWLMTTSNRPGISAPFFPGAAAANTAVNYNSKAYTSNYGFDYIFSPKLINQFKAGFLYNASLYSTANLYVTQPDVVWSYGTSGQAYATPSGHYYPLFNLSDSMTWQHGAHTVQYGASWYREQDHYYNNPVGFTQYSLGVAGGDSALLNAINKTTLPGATQTEVTRARNLYATLNGRITSAAGQTTYSKKTNSYSQPGQTTPYDLDELMSSSGIFVQDSWKIFPTLTLNYGLRWDFVGEDYDLTGAYHSSDTSSIYGPTTVGALFQPGVLGGNPNPSYTTQPVAYNPWKVTPQPAFGFVWNPRLEDGPLKSILGGDSTVIRGGYALRRYTEPEQFVWDYSTSFGSFFYQTYSATAEAGGGAGTFAPGSQVLGGPAITNFNFTPPTYLATEAQSDFTFNPSAPPITGIDRNIKQPYVQSWNLGIQRSLGHNLALEVRYNGNRSIHQWLAIDPNEVNIFENGFLTEFKNAQANLQNGDGTSFTSRHGAATPILDAAFGGQDGAGYQDQSLIYNIQTGQVGNVAQLIAGAYYDNPTYFCNLVGANFAPCAKLPGFTGGGTYPINFFQANPYSPGTGTGYLAAVGYSNYNGLQVDLRQGTWHGLQYDANYTWSKSLGVNSKQDYAAGFNGYTLRDLHKSYVPSQFDLRNVFHAYGTYDLPFGKNQAFLNQSGLFDRALGHWTVGTIITYQGGAPVTLTGQNYTYNDYGDGGVVLNNVTPAQLQKSVGVHHIPGQPTVNILDPKYLASPTGGSSNLAYISPNTTPGTIARIITLHGPKTYNEDLSISKAIPLFEKIDFRLQGEFLNVWNHPTFGNTSYSIDGGIQDGGFSQSSQTNIASGGYGRVIEIRANFEF
jgi:hypothetical protein